MKPIVKSVQANITETVIDASKEVGLEVNTEKTKYILMSCRQNSGQNHDIKIANRSFENMVQFKYLGMTVKRCSCPSAYLFKHYGSIAPPFMSPALDGVSGQLHAPSAVPLVKLPLVPIG
jgi:hypothetical protein